MASLVRWLGIMLSEGVLLLSISQGAYKVPDSLSLEHSELCKVLMVGYWVRLKHLLT